MENSLALDDRESFDDGYKGMIRLFPDFAAWDAGNASSAVSGWTFTPSGEPTRDQPLASRSRRL